MVKVVECAWEWRACVCFMTLLSIMMGDAQRCQGCDASITMRGH